MAKRLIFLLVLSVSALAAAQITVKQPPKATVLEGYPAEEEESIPGKPKRKVIIEEEGPPPVIVPRGCYYVRMEDLARAAADMKTPALKAILAGHIVAFDQLTANDGVVTRVCPVPVFRDGKFPDLFGVFPLSEAQEPRRVTTINRLSVRRIDHYEELLARAAERLLNPPLRDRTPADEADAGDRALVAEQLLSAALVFYDTARDLSKRRGAGWDRVRADTVARLADVRLKRLRIAAEKKDWVTVRALGARMATLYPTNLKLLEEVFAVRLAEGVLAAQSEQLTDLERAGELLREFESRFPGSKNPAAEQVRSGLHVQKDKLFKRAETAVKTEDKEATRLLRTLEAIDPNYPGLRDLQGQLKTGYTIVSVGVPRLPSRMSPVAARTDADRMAVELVYESLFDAVPDDALGTRYRPNLAASFPGIRTGARDIRLVHPLDWAGLPRQYADAADVAGTLRLLKGEYARTWAAANADWLVDQPRVEDQHGLRIGFHGAHPYPLSLLEFKILPTRWLAAQGWKADDPKMLMHPYGTGPFKAIPGSDGKVTAFAANPNYGRRPGRLGQPFIKEIRFVDASKKLNLPAEFKTEQLHILPDIPTADINKYEGSGSGLQGRVLVVTASQNRRVGLLAVNHRRPTMRSVPLRRGLAHAIDRETILTQVYRAGRSEFHKAMTGPFPPESWAVPRLPAAPRPLFDRDLAAAKFAEHNRANGSTILRLVIPADDPRAKTAAGMIARQVEALGATMEGKVSIQVEPLPFDDFEKTVYREANFDLAWLSFDYPDDWYPFGLSALLDPAASEPGGRNVGGYLDKQANTTGADQAFAGRLLEVRRHADYTGKLVPLAYDLHRRFLEAMPFVPLWQLDRHTVISTKLKIAFDDATPNVSPKLLPPSIFTQVGRWKLE